MKIWVMQQLDTGSRKCTISLTTSHINTEAASNSAHKGLLPRGTFHLCPKLLVISVRPQIHASFSNKGPDPTASPGTVLSSPYCKPARVFFLSLFIFLLCLSLYTSHLLITHVQFLLVLGCPLKLYENLLFVYDEATQLFLSPRPFFNTILDKRMLVNTFNSILLVDNERLTMGYV